MKTSILSFLCGLLCTISVHAQQLYSATNTEVSFFSDAPLEDIEATCKTGQSLINTATREVAVKIPIKSFKFPNSLMQEHFNENYMESEKYPHAVFKGKINENIDFSKPGTYPVTATGRINIHGVERDQTIKGTLTVAPNQLNLEAKFDVLLADHQIKIPEVVFMKIAEKIAVTTKFSYKPFEKKAN